MARSSSPDATTRRPARCSRTASGSTRRPAASWRWRSAHEREGKFASAYREYLEAEARAGEEKQRGRARAARERSAALRPLLSRLTIDASSLAELPGGALRWNGVPLEASQLGVAHLVDGGTVEFEASALGYRVWRTMVVAPSGDALTVFVPPLEPLSIAELAPEPAEASLASELPSFAPVAERPVPAPPPAARRRARADDAPRPRRARRDRRRRRGHGPRRVCSWLSAVSRDRDSKAAATNNVCTPAAREARLAAHRSGNAATVSFAAGGALVMGGMISYFLRTPASR